MPFLTQLRDSQRHQGEVKHIRGFQINGSQRILWERGACNKDFNFYFQSNKLRRSGDIFSPMTVIELRILWNIAEWNLGSLKELYPQRTRGTGWRVMHISHFQEKWNLNAVFSASRLALLSYNSESTQLLASVLKVTLYFHFSLLISASDNL